MSTTQHERQYKAMQSQKVHPMYRHPSYDRSFDSVRFPSNASQPSLSHSIATYTESTPSSICRPDFGDYAQDMSVSDCGTSVVSEVTPSFDDTSDIDEAPPYNGSKPTLIKFIEPVVQREHSNGQPRLTGMKKKMQRKKSAAALQAPSELDVHHLPVLEFADARARYEPEDGLHQDMLNFPGVPPREVHVAPKQEQWNVDTIDIALEDLVLDKGKARLTLKMSSSQSRSTDAADSNPSASRQQPMGMAGIKAPTAHSVLDEAHQHERQHRSHSRTTTLSDARRYQRVPSVDAPLPPLPRLPSSLVHSHDSNALSASCKVAGLEPSHDDPLAAQSSTGLRGAGNGNVGSPGDGTDYSPEEEENVFAFSPPSLSSHSEGARLGASAPEPRPTRTTARRADSMASSNHSSLRDLDPRDVIQRARMQPLSCGLDAEIIGGSLDLADECASLDAASSVQAEDLPPLLSNHYLQGKVDQAEFERLNRLPERMQAAAAAAAAHGSHRRAPHKQSTKHKKGVATSLAVQHYEPISILRAEAAFLNVDTKKSDKKDKKKDRPWNKTSGSSGSSITSRTHLGTSSTSSLGRTGVNASSSDVSSVSEGHQRLRSFKSSIRLKAMK